MKMIIAFDGMKAIPKSKIRLIEVCKGANNTAALCCTGAPAYNSDIIMFIGKYPTEECAKEALIKFCNELNKEN